MTLCIVSHSASGHLVAMSDRMLSRGPARHLPPTPKGYILHSSIYCMYAGGISLAGSIVLAAQVRLANEYGARAGACSVHKAAHYLREAYEAARLIEAAAQILPLYFISGPGEYQQKRHTLPASTIKSIERRISRWGFASEEEPAFIVFGYDGSGPHVYKVQASRVDGHDPFGFAAIGLDTSVSIVDQLMYDHQAWHMPFGAALALAYVAANNAVDTRNGVGPPEDVLILRPDSPEVPVLVGILGTMRLKHLYEFTIVKGMGGIQAAIQLAHSFMPDENLGVTLPTAPPPAVAPPPPPDPTDGP